MKITSDGKLGREIKEKNEQTFGKNDKSYR